MKKAQCCGNCRWWREWFIRNGMGECIYPVKAAKDKVPVALRLAILTVWSTDGEHCPCFEERKGNGRKT